MPLPVIAITVGDPGGIGPEIARKAAASPRVTTCCRPVLYGPWRDEALAAFEIGRPSAASGQAAYDAIATAVGDALEKKVDAIATGPVSKEGLALATSLVRPRGTVVLKTTVHDLGALSPTP